MDRYNNFNDLNCQGVDKRKKSPVGNVSKKNSVNQGMFSNIIIETSLYFEYKMIIVLSLLIIFGIMSFVEGKVNVSIFLGLIAIYVLCFENINFILGIVVLLFFGSNLLLEKENDTNNSIILFDKQNISNFVKLIYIFKKNSKTVDFLSIFQLIFKLLILLITLNIVDIISDFIQYFIVVFICMILLFTYYFTKVSNNNGLSNYINQIMELFVKFKNSLSGIITSLWSIVINQMADNKVKNNSSEG